MSINFKHGRCGTREYYSWTGLRNRCLNPRNRAYHNYGGRGIKVCQRWLDSFSNFYSDMGSKPPRMTLERIDNNGDYSPDNCVWATRKAQAANTRRTRLVTIRGTTMPASWWADGNRINRGTLSDRLRNGWHPALAVTAKPRSVRAKDRAALQVAFQESQLEPVKMTYADIAREDGVCVATARTYASRKHYGSSALKVVKKNGRNHRIRPDDWLRFQQERLR